MLINIQKPNVDTGVLPSLSHLLKEINIINGKYKKKKEREKEKGIEQLYAISVFYVVTFY